jgi:hypothetical protein
VNHQVPSMASGFFSKLLVPIRQWYTDGTRSFQFLFFGAAMTDTYRIAKALSDHVDATLRVVERLTIVLHDGLEGGRADDMASALKPKANLPNSDYKTKR